MQPHQFILAALSVAVSARGVDDSQTRLFVQHKMISAHDAAMAYVPPTDPRSPFFVTQRFAWESINATDESTTSTDGTNDTQGDSPLDTITLVSPSAFVSFLDCGWRVLDLRVQECDIQTVKPAGNGVGAQVNLSLCLHHGALTVEKYTLETELPAIVQWVNGNPDDLVMLKIDHSGFPGADGPTLNNRRALVALLNEYNISMITRVDPASLDSVESDGFINVSLSCWGDDSIGSWTMDKALSEASGVPGGGLLLAVDGGCVDDNYDAMIGYDPRNVTASFDALWAYANTTILDAWSELEPNASLARLQEVQLMWQSGASAIATIQAGLEYDILDTIAVSEINQRVEERVAERYKYDDNVNMIKMDGVCNSGVEVAEALGVVVTDAQRQRCRVACGQPVMS